MGGDGDQIRFAKKVFDTSKGTYNHWETAKGLIPVWRSLQILDKEPGLTLDYIYRGDFRSVASDIADRLRAAPPRPKDGRFSLDKAAAPTLETRAATLLEAFPLSLRGSPRKPASSRKRRT